MLISCCNFPHFQVGHLPHLSTEGTEDGARQHGGGGGAVPGHVVGLGGHLFDQGRAQVVLPRMS